ncbi:hypothetical protein C2E23DRAFT_898602 [Lenzites betulinus]|nr:hypothetical protein C2E23DRAFT_898602 [Lenzites betulinus]
MITVQRTPEPSRRAIISTSTPSCMPFLDPPMRAVFSSMFSLQNGMQLSCLRLSDFTQQEGLWTGPLTPSPGTRWRRPRPHPRGRPRYRRFRISRRARSRSRAASHSIPRPARTVYPACLPLFPGRKRCIAPRIMGPGAPVVVRPSAVAVRRGSLRGTTVKVPRWPG